MSEIADLVGRWGASSIGTRRTADLGDVGHLMDVVGGSVVGGLMREVLHATNTEWDVVPQISLSAQRRLLGDMK